jgi:SAM-dependent methyltransferase
MNGDHVARARAAYGDSAAGFAESVGVTISPDFEAPIDQAVLATFADLARPASGRTLDAGCGTGRVARYLADRLLDVVAVDVAPGMIRTARAAHPDMEFHVAELTDLPFRAGSLAGVAYWYSIITTPPDALVDVWNELDRALATGGVVAVAFQCGAGDRAERPQAYGTTTDLTLYRHDPDHVRSGLAAIGLDIHTFVQRRPWFEHEHTDQAFLIASKS